ncbi:hypothetical protein N8I71_11200 [Roseibacterium sp. SDUM158016]|uniref:hypothetical protein n=1 Tax=Roseicyclus sediminis TaxID=2980997 RepID=UPI0021D287A4|nr:hypothetical protein [Roseibacterium sp. SDUM158016]MCU4653403.1 hypothetical protein [Roseibacterium sp. SDUM158016]
MPRPLAASRIATAALALVLPAGGVVAEGIAPPDAATVEARLEVLNSPVPGSIWALQPWMNAQEATDAEGTLYRLTSLNPRVNSWFVLEVAPAGGRSAFYHLENADADLWQVSLAETENGPRLRLEDDLGDVVLCDPWAGELAEARATGLPYAPVCDWSLFLRNPVQGNRTTREAVSDFLRENVIFGDSIVNLIKGAFYEDAFMVSSEELDTAEEVSGVELLGTALLDRAPVMRPAMGFDLLGAEAGMQAGSWYEVDGAPGIYASVMQPGMIAQSVFDVPGANWLDGVESGADVYLVAFDMARFDIGYELGTDHPDLGWSSRPSNRHGGAGPDGFSRPDPLVLNGTLSPSLVEDVAAAFTGGFKRDHGAWRFGDYATFNFGHHYGFVQQGVMLSRLWPNLATLYVTHDGEVHMETWTEGHAEVLPELVMARQNGVPLIENGVPGDRVTSWGGGNWSGSAEANLRTLRAGACLRTVGDRPFLIYAYFSTATPSAMARTFQAYQCDYAMLLDMNSQELTYMALYLHEGDEIEPRHLVSGMADVDVRGSRGTRIPRFVSAPDNRDFFYLVRRD